MHGVPGIADVELHVVNGLDLEEICLLRHGSGINLGCGLGRNFCHRSLLWLAEGFYDKGYPIANKKLRDETSRSFSRYWLIWAFAAMARMLRQ